MGELFLQAKATSAALHKDTGIHASMNPCLPLALENQEWNVQCFSDQLGDVLSYDYIMGKKVSYKKKKKNKLCTSGSQSFGSYVLCLFNTGTAV